MRAWLTQRSTWLGIGSAVVAVLGVLVANDIIDPMWSALAAGVLSAFGLKVNDKGVGKSMSVLPILAFSAAIASGCVKPDYPACSAAEAYDARCNGDAVEVCNGEMWYVVTDCSEHSGVDGGLLGWSCAEGDGGAGCQE